MFLFYVHVVYHLIYLAFEFIEGLHCTLQVCCGQSETTSNSKDVWQCLMLFKECSFWHFRNASFNSICISIANPSWSHDEKRQAQHKEPVWSLALSKISEERTGRCFKKERVRRLCSLDFFFHELPVVECSHSRRGPTSLPREVESTVYQVAGETCKI